MFNISQIPREIANVIPKFDGDEKLLNLFIRKCEYVIRLCRVDDSREQDLYIFHVVTSRLCGKAAALISERQDLDTWDSLKTALEQHFGDPRSEECIAIELETLKINNGESYLDFCNRIQHIKSTLIAKVNLIQDDSLRKSKVIIYDNMSMNVFLYNLPEDLLRIVRLKGCDSLEKALSIVLEEVNFMFQYSSRNKMLKQQNTQCTAPRPQPFNNFQFSDKNVIKPHFISNTQPQYKFGIPQNVATMSNQPQQQNKFKFGIPASKQIKLPQTQQFGYRPQNQTHFGYRPPLNQNQFGYKPNLNQPQFGYRPQLNQNNPQFGYKPQQFGYRPPQVLQPRNGPTDVSMRTAKPLGIRMNELYNLNDDDNNYNNSEIQNPSYDDYSNTEVIEEFEAIKTDQTEEYDPVVENFHIITNNQPPR